MIKSASIIGSGNVATHLAKALFNAGVEIKSIYSPTLATCRGLADKVSAKPVENIADIDSSADIIIISVKDDAIHNVVEELNNDKAIIVHTSGGVNIDVFEGYSDRCGVLYPLQTFSKDREIDFSRVPLFVEASNKNVYAEIEDLAKRLSNYVVEANSEKRKTLHVAAVFACNFVNHCYDISEQILKENGLSFSALLPLIEETTNKIYEISPYDAQTGPARRNDVTVMNNHLKKIKNQTFKDIYTLLSKSITERYK
ncbi:MAG: DUF2520 domain-containing protein [Bacteroidales bacterium]|nr:DUF2520 domain-containing protein [Bacteroidales bacterium]